MERKRAPIRDAGNGPAGQKSDSQDPYRLASYGAAALYALTLPAIVATTVAFLPRASSDRGGQSSPVVLAGDSPMAPPVSSALGRSVYQMACAVCHAPGGEGVPRLGKPLRNSAFVQAQSDEALFRLIAEGRGTGDPSNTTGALMPARGAQGLDDGAIRAVIGHLRSMQEPGADAVSVDAWNITNRDADPGAVAAFELTAHAGYDLYIASCAACHGQGGEGIEGLGLPLSTSGFARGKSDADLVSFIKSGRPSWDENNSTGIDMPPKGGNPAITDDQIQTIVEYIRALQAEAMGS